MATELLETRDEENRRLGVLRFATSAKLADANTNGDCVRIQLSIGNLLESKEFALTREQWAKLRTAIDNGFNEFYPPRYTTEIRAEIKSDDGQADCKFNAVDWFKQASDEEIECLINSGLGGDEPADRVGLFFEETNTQVSRVLDHARLTGGFEVYIRSVDAERWIQRHKPHLAKLFDE